MAIEMYHYEATVDFSKTEAWEAEALLYFLKEMSRYERQEISIKGRFMVFEYVDCGNSLWWDWEGPRIYQEGAAECLDDILRNLMAKHALSLTYLYDWNPGGGCDEDDPLSKYDYEELAERIPTLVLQAVLEKRLTES